MVVVVNANDNTVELKDCKVPFSTKCKSPYETMKLLDEIFNRLSDQIDEKFEGTYYLDVELEYIDEDTRKTVGEW